MATRSTRKPAKKPTRSKRRSSKSAWRKLLNPIAIIPIVVIVALVGLILYAHNSRNKDVPQLAPDFKGDLQSVVTAPDLDEVLIEYTGMTVSFNRERHIPNWVSWELTADEVSGEEPRSKGFVADTRIDGCADPKDYRHSGFDRGHMAPAGDMKWSEQAMQESFYMTNICPQDNHLNTGPWRKLEESCRKWAKRDSAIVIVCGPVPTDPVEVKIGANQVWVPQRFFKAVIAPYADPPRGIAFIMENKAFKGGIQKTVVSIDEVERITGHDLFHLLPDDIENEIESQANFNKWSY